MERVAAHKHAMEVVEGIVAGSPCFDEEPARSIDCDSGGYADLCDELQDEALYAADMAGKTQSALQAFAEAASQYLAASPAGDTAKGKKNKSARARARKERCDKLSQAINVCGAVCPCGHGALSVSFESAESHCGGCNSIAVGRIMVSCSLPSCHFRWCGCNGSAKPGGVDLQAIAEMAASYAINQGGFHAVQVEHEQHS